MSSRSLNWLKFGGLVALAFALGLLFAGLLDLPNRTVAQEQGRAAGALGPPGRKIKAAVYDRLASDDYKQAGPLQQILVKLIPSMFGGG